MQGIDDETKLEAKRNRVIRPRPVLRGLGCRREKMKVFVLLRCFTDELALVAAEGS
jgi:hypothetical protein